MAGGNHWAIYKQLKEDLNFGRAINNPAPVADWPPTQKFLAVCHALVGQRNA